jgi:hypothetical protein
MDIDLERLKRYRADGPFLGIVGLRAQPIDTRRDKSPA